MDTMRFPTQAELDQEMEELLAMVRRAADHKLFWPK